MTEIAATIASDLLSIQAVTLGLTNHLHGRVGFTVRFIRTIA